MRTWLYLPNGCKHEFEYDAGSDPDKDYSFALDYTNRLLALGASVEAPGLEAGEQKEQVGYISRRSKINDDATETPVLDLFPNHEATKFKFLTVYLNTPEDVAMFENASGFMLADIPLWEGDKHLDRGSAKTDKYIMQVTRPFFAVHKANARYNPDEPDITKRKPKRLFVRWESVGIPTPPPAPQPPQNAAIPTPATVTPETPQNAGNGASGAMLTPEGKVVAVTNAGNGTPDALEDIWNIAPTGGHWTRLRKYLFTVVYKENKYEFDGSLAKRAKQTNNWKRGDGSQMTVGNIVDFLRTRHEGEKAGLKEAS